MIGRSEICRSPDRGVPARRAGALDREIYDRAGEGKSTGPRGPEPLALFIDETWKEGAPVQRIGSEIHWPILCVLVRSELNQHPEFRDRARDGDLIEHCKRIAARAGLAYDSAALGKAVDAVHASRAARVARQRAGYRPRERDAFPRL